MKYKVHTIGEGEHLVRDEDDNNIATLDNEAAARLFANALNLRDRTLLQLAHSFVETIDSGECSAKMSQQWQGIVLSNGLSKDDEDELWAMLRTVLEQSKGPGQ